MTLTNEENWFIVCVMAHKKPNKYTGRWYVEYEGFQDAITAAEAAEAIVNTTAKLIIVHSTGFNNVLSQLRGEIGGLNRYEMTQRNLQKLHRQINRKGKQNVRRGAASKNKRSSRKRPATV